MTYEESLEASKLRPSIYERIEDSGFRALSELFYDRVFADNEAQWFLNIFSSSTRQEAVENQVSPGRVGCCCSAVSREVAKSRAQTCL